MNNYTMLLAKDTEYRKVIERDFQAEDINEAWRKADRYAYEHGYIDFTVFQMEGGNK